MIPAKTNLIKANGIEQFMTKANMSTIKGAFMQIHLCNTGRKSLNSQIAINVLNDNKWGKCGVCAL